MNGNLAIEYFLCTSCSSWFCWTETSLIDAAVPAPVIRSFIWILKNQKSDRLLNQDCESVLNPRFFFGWRMQLSGLQDGSGQNVCGRASRHQQTLKSSSKPSPGRVGNKTWDRWHQLKTRRVSSLMSSDPSSVSVSLRQKRDKKPSRLLLHLSSPRLMAFSSLPGL